MRHSYHGGATKGKGELPVELNSMTTVVVPKVEVGGGEVRPTNYRTKAVDVGEDVQLDDYQKRLTQIRTIRKKTY